MTLCKKLTFVTCELSQLCFALKTNTYFSKGAKCL